MLEGYSYHSSYVNFIKKILAQLIEIIHVALFLTFSLLHRCFYVLTRYTIVFIFKYELIIVVSYPPILTKQLGLFNDRKKCNGVMKLPKTLIFLVCMVCCMRGASAFCCRADCYCGRCQTGVEFCCASQCLCTCGLAYSKQAS